MSDEPEDEFFDEIEAARRRDEVVKRMLATPPQPRTSPKDTVAAPRRSARAPKT